MSQTEDLAAPFESIDACGVVAILRGAFLAHIDTIVDGLLSGGVRAIEISLTSRDAFATIERAAVRAGSRAAVGAGTVLTRSQVTGVARHGGTFIVSPTVDAEVIATALDIGLPPLPGAYTPTEALTATRLGAAAVKLFPAETLGPAFVRALLAPLPDLKLVPTGGVTLDRARAFAEAGAWAVGVGGPLVSGTQDLDSLASRAAAFVAAMRPR